MPNRDLKAGNFYHMIVSQDWSPGKPVRDMVVDELRTSDNLKEVIPLFAEPGIIFIIR